MAEAARTQAVTTPANRLFSIQTFRPALKADVESEVCACACVCVCA